MWSINRGVNSGFIITFLFDKDEGRFLFVEIFNKNKKKIPDKNRINELFKKGVNIQEELYDNEELIWIIVKYFCYGFY